MGRNQQARDADKHHANPVAVAGTRAEPSREHLAIYAGQLALEAGLRKLRRDLRSLDQPHRNP